MMKLDINKKNISKDNLRKLKKLFPSIITELECENGNLIETVNVDKLKELIGDFSSSKKEKYELTWVGKQASKKKIIEPSKKILRPIKEDSVDWETTQNLYIEGDNFEVLKIIQESYLGKVDLIYIDPPYNTGNDFIYKDDFKQTEKEYNKALGSEDVVGYKMFQNTESNGRFHSDWLSMMFERLYIARHLLSEDGAIFISIDDHEIGNLIYLCDEIFGINNCVAQLVWNTKNAARGVPPKSMVIKNHEYILVYAKGKDKFSFKGVERNKKDFSNPDNDPRGIWRSESLRATGKQNNKFNIVNPETGHQFYGNWAFSKKSIDNMIKENRIFFPKKEKGVPRQKKFFNSYINKKAATVTHLGRFSTENGTKKFMELFDGGKYFDFTKPIELMKYIIDQSTKKNSIVLDFFSGSATTAHAVMELNVCNDENRNFIMVQLPEITNVKSEAHIAGYKNICEIGKERIRRATNNIKKEYCDKDLNNVDFGFRVFKVENKISQTETDSKEKRNDLDILFEVLLGLGFGLSLPIEQKYFNNNNIYIVDNNSLIACFNENININTIQEIIKLKPSRLIFKEFSLKNYIFRTNCEELIRLKSPNTIIYLI